jgi:2-oxoglutarate ferredoxin oxidoreductase subunit alpha
MPTRTQQADLLSCAYASHGDTRHVLLFPCDPHECFELGAQAFDLADRLQTPIFLMSDLDIGMNEWLVPPLAWDDARKFDRGKVMSEAELETGKDFVRYLDAEGDGIAYRTYPGTHATRGAYFTRGTSRNRYARYSEEGAVYVDNMERLLKKFAGAKRFLPANVHGKAAQPTRNGVIYFGSTAVAMDEAIAVLAKKGVMLDTLRIRAYPFADDVAEFVRAHDRVFVVEQNRDAQMRTLMMDFGIDATKLVPVLHYDGTPITAHFIAGDIGRRVGERATPLRKVAS